MSFYKPLLKHLILPIGDMFFGGSYLKHIAGWKALDGKSEVELDAIQNESLEKILNHAIKNVPYYKNQKSKRIENFPILTKSILRDSVNELVSDLHNIKKLDKHHSSGSTGMQSFTYMTHRHKFYLRALQTHWWNWSGYTFGNHLLQFGISEKRTFAKRLKDLFLKCIYVKAFGLSETELKDILNSTSNKSNLYVAGYPSVINELAKASLNDKISPNINGIICYGDKLFNHYKENIYAAFGNELKLIDTYGCAEGLLMACKYDLDYYYIMSPHVYIEIVDDEGKIVKDGEMGNVLVTCLTNYAMPIIRYQLGDLAIKLPKEKYPKNRLLNYPLLEKIIGRETDIIKTTKGITLNVHSFTGVLEYYQDIKQYKVIQNNLKSIIIEYIVDDNLVLNQDVLNAIKSKLNNLTGNCLEIIFKKVNEIKPGKSGKPQIIESNLKTL